MRKQKPAVYKDMEPGDLVTAFFQECIKLRIGEGFSTHLYVRHLWPKGNKKLIEQAVERETGIAIQVKPSARFTVKRIG
jgi:hypothetical protein